jgi:hypothetical protein
MKPTKICFVLMVLLLAFGCQSKEESAETPSAEKAAEPDYIAVQHILIGFEGSVPGKNITRSREQARELAKKIYEQAKAGGDFDAMVAEYTDDSHPGIYKMANFGVEADMGAGVFPRDRMVPAFGDVGFPLAVGEIGLAEHDPVKSKYGWHIIKRVE